MYVYTYTKTRFTKHSLSSDVEVATTMARKIMYNDYKYAANVEIPVVYEGKHLAW